MLYVEIEAVGSHASPREPANQWLKRLKGNFDAATLTLTKRQLRYRKNYNAHIRPRRRFPKVREQAFVRKEQTGKKESWHKLTQKALGPFKVVQVSEDGRAITVDLGKSLESVTASRVEILRADEQGQDETHGEDRDDAELEYVVDKIVGHEQLGPLNNLIRSSKSDVDMANLA